MKTKIIKQMIAAVVAVASFATMPAFVASAARRNNKNSNKKIKYFEARKQLRKDKFKVKSENKRKGKAPDEVKVEEKVPDEVKVEGKVPDEVKVEGKVPDEVKVEEKAPDEVKVEGQAPDEVKVEGKASDEVKVEGKAPDEVKVEEKASDEVKEVNDLVNRLFNTFDKEQQFEADIIDIMEKLTQKKDLYDKTLFIAKFIYNRVLAGKSPYVNNFQRVLRLLSKCFSDDESKFFVDRYLNYMFSGKSKFGIALNSDAVREIIYSFCQCDGEYLSIVSSINLLIGCYNFVEYLGENEINAIFDLFLKCLNDTRIKNLFDDASCLSEKIRLRNLIALVIQRMKVRTLFANISKDQISKMLDIFDDFFANRVFCKNLIMLINDLILYNNFRNCSRDEILKLKNLLLKFRGYRGYRTDAVIIIKNLILNNYLQRCSKEDILEIMNALLEIVNGANSIIYFSYVMENLLKQGFLKDYPAAEMLKLADRLTYIFENEDVRKNYLSIMMLLFDGGFLKNCNENDLSKIIIAISRCSNREKFRQSCAVLVAKFANSGLLGSLKEDDLLQIKNILNNCSNDENSKEYVANIAKILIDRGFFQKTTDEIVKIIDLLLKCSGNERAESHILGSIEKLISNNCFLTYPKDRVFDVTDLLYKYQHKYCSKYNDDNGMPRMIIDSDQSRDENIMYRIKMAIYKINEQAGFKNESLFDESLRRKQEGYEFMMKFFDSKNGYLKSFFPNLPDEPPVDVVSYSSDESSD